MTIKTYLNEAARKSNKGPTPPCVNAKPLTQRRILEPVRPLESISEHYFYYYRRALYPLERLTVLVIYRTWPKQLDRFYTYPIPEKRLIIHGWKYNDNFLNVRSQRTSPAVPPFAHNIGIVDTYMNAKTCHHNPMHLNLFTMCIKYNIILLLGDARRRGRYCLCNKRCAL